LKHFSRSICVILVIAMMLAVPVLAETETAVTPYASSYFISYCAYLYKTTGTTFEVWFEVVARSGMDELGVSEIKVQRSADGNNWTTMRTYTPEYYPQMICEDTGAHGDCVTYTGTAGYQYRAYITFYAKNSGGYAKRYVYAYFL